MTLATRNGRVRIGGVLALLILAIFVTAAAWLPWGVSTGALMQAITDQIRARTGYTVETSGRSTFALLPRPRIKVDGVTIRSADDSFVVDTQNIKGDLDLWALLTGRVQVSALSLVTPTISINGDVKPSAAPLRAPETGSPESWLGNLTIVSGLIRWHHPSSGFETLVEDINVRLDWAGASAPASLTGSASWRGETETVAAVLSDPQAVISAGKASTLSLKLGGRALMMSADGQLSAENGLGYAGRISAQTRAPAALARMSGFGGRWTDDLRGAQIDANVALSAGTATLSQLKMMINDSDIQGSLMLMPSAAGLQASGTLASHRLDLTPFSGLWPTLLSADGTWSREPFDGASPWPDLDLRLSAERARIGRFDLADVGFSIMTSPSRAEVTLSDAKAYGGSVKGRLTALRSGAGFDVRASGALNHVDAATSLAAGWNSRRLSGDTSGQFTLAASGDTPAALSRAVSGSAQFTMRDGEIAGIDFEEALRRLEKKPLSIMADVHSGRTPFSMLQAGIDVKDGLAKLDSCWASGPGIALAISGTARMADRMLDLQSVARQAGTDSTSSDTGPQLRLGVTGPWDDLAMVLDTEGLIRRSGAAAPLLPKPARLPTP